MREPSVLGTLSEEQFLSDYWQQKPLLIRNAWPNFQAPIDADELAGLALEDEIESRLIIGSDCAVEQGPFAEDRFASLPTSEWTLLVQAVDLWVPEVAEMLRRFSFLPRWRIDDIMVSYATDGGGVGPHFDDYDVFLLQGSGQRRWQIGDYCDANSALSEHSQLKILDAFDAQQDWLLNPGDMLYLPPRLAHCGVAVGECCTYSIGFRAPSAADMLDDLATEMLSRGAAHDYLRDPPLRPCDDPELIPQSYIQQTRDLLHKIIDDDQVLGEWFAQYMTQPKYPHLTDITGETRRAHIALPDSTDSTSGGGERVTRFSNGALINTETEQQP